MALWADFAQRRSISRSIACREERPNPATRRAAALEAAAAPPLDLAVSHGRLYHLFAGLPL